MSRRTPHDLLAALSRSRFRASFVLDRDDAEQLADRDGASIRGVARAIVRARLSSAAPANDGRQTPYRGNPVFVAQHATATCCRRCLAKWHGMPAGVGLSAAEVEHVVDVLCLWLERRRRPARQLDLALIVPPTNSIGDPEGNASRAG